MSNENTGATTAPASDYRTDNGQYDPANREGRYIPPTVVNNITIAAPVIPRRTHHVLHLVLTLLTGVWVFVWIWRTIANRRWNRRHGVIA